MTRSNIPSFLRFYLFALVALFSYFIHAEDADSGDATLKEIKVAEGAFTRGDPLPTWAQPLAEVPASKRHDPLVVRLAETQFHVGETHSLLVNRAEQVNDAASLGSIGEYPLYFTPAYQKLRLHRVAIQRGKQIFDRTQKVNVRFLQRETGLDAGMYSGMVTAMLLIEDVRVGDTLLITYSVDGQNPVFANTYAEMANWDQNEPVELRRVWLMHPSNRPIQWRQLGDFNTHAITPEVSEKDGTRRLKFEERNLEGIDDEPDVPSDYFPYRFIEFSEYADWHAVAQWADSLFPPVTTLPPELNTLVARIKQRPTQEEQASAALQWVEDEIRYFSISMGESSHRPYPPAQVVARRFGDCKDKAYLLVTLLHALDIQAEPILLSAESPEMPNRIIPAPTVFDHVVVAAHIHGKTYYLDGTRLGENSRLDRIAPTLPGAYGLIVSPTTSALTRLDNDALPALSTHELSEILTIKDLNGDATLDATQTWAGDSAEYLRLSFSRMTTEQLHKQVLGNYARHYPGIELVGKPEVKDDPVLNTYTLHMHFKIPKPVNEYRDGWSIGYFPNNLSGVLTIPDKVNRNFPLAQSETPYIAHYHLVVNWPDTISASEDPQRQHLDSDFFNLETIRQFRGNVTSLDVNFEVKQAKVAAHDVPKLVADIKKVDNVLTGNIIVARDDLKQTSKPGGGVMTVQDTLRNREQLQLDRVTAVLNSGRLSGEDRAEALCARADAELSLDQVAAAGKDAEEAIQFGPVYARAWECHADQLSARGEFTQAIGEYGKALSLGAPLVDIYYRRGRAYFYSGQLERAATDFAKARTQPPSSLAGGDGGIDPRYAALWESWTLARLHKPLPEEIMTLAHSEPSDAWPLPALAMFTDAKGPNDVLAALNKKQGDDRELSSVEAWFYIGQYELTHGHYSQARQAFEKVRASGITMYDEYMAAGFELKSLNSVKTAAAAY